MYEYGNGTFKQEMSHRVLILLEIYHLNGRFRMIPRSGGGGGVSTGTWYLVPGLTFAVLDTQSNHRRCKNKTSRMIRIPMIDRKQKMSTSNDNNDVTIDEIGNMTTSTATSLNNQQQPLPILQWKTKKRPRLRENNNLVSNSNNNAFVSEFTIDEKNGDSRPGNNTSVPAPSGPLIIPVLPDHNKWKLLQQRQDEINNPSIVHNVEDLAAIQSLQDDAKKNHFDTVTSNSPSITAIRSHANTFVGGKTTTTSSTDREVHQYHTDLQALPAALDETSDVYQRIPITEFGAALLRGMGWTDNNNNDENTTATGINTQSTSTSVNVMPRPHRLGLGAIPAMITEPTDVVQEGHRRPRTIDQYQRDQQKQKQNEMYRIERENKLANDMQRTMQNGSIVRLLNHHHKRARIVKLVGVPGLNMVQIQLEDSTAESSSAIIKRNEIDCLITREELEKHPFRELTTSRDVEEVTSSQRNLDGKSKKASKNDDLTNNVDKHDRKERKRSDEGKDKKRSRKEDKNSIVNGSSWVVPNIRVRIITEKLGRKYYKEKGIVVDVTRNSGVTIQLQNSNSNDGSTAFVLDRIPERYLETALPKTGGNVIVVNSEHTNRYCKGRLLERNSRDGVVQLYDDMDCVTIPLDDIAEWCGPLDDDGEAF
jgi:hypothetical protein